LDNIPRGGRPANKSLDLVAYRKKVRGSKNLDVSKMNIFVLSSIFFVVLAYIFAGLVSIAGKPKLQTVSVERGSVDVPTIFQGVIVRDEIVYKSPAAGTLRFDYSDLSKIKKGARVCVIQDDEAVTRISANIDAVKERMLARQEQRGDISNFSQDVKRVNGQIQAIVDGGRARLLRDVSAVYALKENVERAIDTRNNMLFGDDQGSMSDMFEEKSLLEQQLEKNIASITAAEGGILSYVVDGLENVLTVDKTPSLTKAQTKMNVDYSELGRKRDVLADAPMFKIITSNEWYIALYAPGKDVEDWQEGDARSIYIAKNGSFETLDVTVAINEKKASSDDNYVLLKCAWNMADYIDARSVNIKLSNSGREGYKIPSACVVDRTLIAIPKQFISDDGKIKIRREDKDEIIKISPVDFDGDELNAYIIADPGGSPRVGDVLAKPTTEYSAEPAVENVGEATTLTRVENIKGVFAARNGYADFIKINFDGALPADYVILDESQNSGLNLNDQIISDAKALKDGQKLD
jgi:hypothetical protein